MTRNTPKQPGRPLKLEGGKRVNLYLDEHTLAKAERLGQGNISAGIRIAVKQAKETK